MKINEIILERAEQIPALVGALQTGTIIDPDKGMVDFDTADEFLTWLHNNYHTEEIGEGYTSIAYAGPDDGRRYVLKKNDGTDRWYAWAADVEHNKLWKNNSLFPEILFVGKRWGSGWAVIEYLEQDSSHLSSIYSNVVWGYEPAGEWSDDSDSSHDEMRVLLDIYLHLTKTTPFTVDFDYKRILRQFKTTPENFQAFMKHCNNFGALDMHNGNAGWRKNGELVFFDPVV